MVHPMSTKTPPGRSCWCGWFAIGDQAWLDMCEAIHHRHCDAEIMQGPRP